MRRYLVAFYPPQKKSVQNDDFPLLIPFTVQAGSTSRHTRTILITRETPLVISQTDKQTHIHTCARGLGFLSLPDRAKPRARALPGPKKWGREERKEKEGTRRGDTIFAIISDKEPRSLGHGPPGAGHMRHSVHASAPLRLTKIRRRSLPPSVLEFGPLPLFLSPRFQTPGKKPVRRTKEAQKQNPHRRHRRRHARAR